MSTILNYFIFTLLSITLTIYVIEAKGFQRTSPIGEWKTFDDETGEQKAVVEIFKRGNKLYGKIIKILNEAKQDNRCTECDKDDPRYNQKVLGMEIIKDMERDGDTYEDGTILDPNNGKVYSCKMYLENNNLIVRGYLGISLLGRSQEWKPHYD